MQLKLDLPLANVSARLQLEPAAELLAAMKRSGAAVVPTLLVGTLLSALLRPARQMRLLLYS